MSGATSDKMWLKYVPPSYYIQERRGVLKRYEIQAPELRDKQLGMVEQYVTREDKIRWRTLDHRKCDWKGDFSTRETASQDLVANCPRTVALVNSLRKRMLNSPQLAENP